MPEHDESNGASALPEWLDAADEQEWLRLRAQLELAEGFWLGFAFASSAVPTAVLRRRAEWTLRARVRGLHPLLPRTPGDLTAAATALAAGEEHGQRLVWLEAGTSGGYPAADWESAWRRALASLNESRSRLQASCRAGLVLALPSRIKPAVSELAIDLWSIRSIVLHLRGPAPPGVSGPPDDHASEERASDYDERARRPVDDQATEEVAAGTTVGAAAAKGYAELQRERPAAARAAFRSALDQLEPDAPATARADLLIALGVAEDAAGNPAGAEDVLTHALDLLPQDAPVMVAALMTLGRLRRDRGAFEAAIKTYRDAVAHARHAVAQAETGSALRDLSASLDKVGDIARARGDLDAAQEAYREALGIDRRLAEQDGSPEVLRDLPVSLRKVGDIARARGDLGAAEEAHREALGIARRLAEQQQTPEALRDLSVSLGGMGRVSEARGDPDAAADAYQESLELLQQLADRYSSPQALQDLLTALERAARNADTRRRHRGRRR